MIPTQTIRRRRRVLPVVIALVLVAAIAASLLWAAANRRYLEDLSAGWQYEPTAEVAAVRDAVAMNDGGRFLFDASAPTLEDAESFNELCDRQDPNFYILGCYDGERIHLYRITDERLAGIVEVTAAHEMLHAAWDRMSDDERSALEPLLESEFARVADDRFRDRMAYYAEAQPGTRVNELHSIIGTETADLAPALEEHYRRYFDDRSAVVALHAGYSGVLREIETRGEQLVVELNALAGTIEAARADYDGRAEVLGADVEDFNARAETPGGFATQGAFTRERDALMARSDELDALRDSVNADIARYEGLRTELENVNAESAGLLQSMDSLQAPEVQAID